MSPSVVLGVKRWISKSKSLLKRIQIHKHSAKTNNLWYLNDFRGATKTTKTFAYLMTKVLVVVLWGNTHLQEWPCPFPKICSWSNPPWQWRWRSGWRRLRCSARKRSRCACREGLSSLRTGLWRLRWMYLSQKYSKMPSTWDNMILFWGENS